MLVIVLIELLLVVLVVFQLVVLLVRGLLEETFLSQQTKHASEKQRRTR